MHFLRLLDIAIPVISSFRVIQLLNHFLQCDFWDNSATLGTALTSPIAHSLTQTDPSWKQWSGCGLQHYIGTLTTSVTSAPLRKVSYKNTWCNTGFHLFWVEFRVSPSEASDAPRTHSTQSWVWDRLGHRIRDRRLLLWPPQLHQVNAMLIMQAKLSWGCNNWDHTNLT